MTNHHNPKTTTDPLLTIEQVADFLGASRTTVRRLIAQHKLAAVRVNRLVRVRDSDLQAFLTNNVTDLR